MRIRVAESVTFTKLTTLMASTGNTQGIKFKIMPPISAPSSAAQKVMGVDDDPACTGAAPAAALACSAACSAGGTCTTGAALGQGPVTGASMRTAVSPAATTTGSKVGLSVRWGDSGSEAVHTAPFHACVQAAAGSVIAPVSGYSARVWPCSAAGRPVSDTFSAWPSTVIWLLPAGCGLGVAAKVAANAAPLLAVELRVVRLSVKVPSCGIHSLRHTSQAALRLTSSWLALKLGATVRGTGSSTVPS